MDWPSASVLPNTNKLLVRMVNGWLLANAPSWISIIAFLAFLSRENGLVWRMEVGLEGRKGAVGSADLGPLFGFGDSIWVGGSGWVPNESS